MAYVEEGPIDDMTNILNAFYYKGENLLEYKDESSVNTLRMLLNESIGTDFEKLDVPYYKLIGE